MRHWYCCLMLVSVLLPTWGVAQGVTIRLDWDYTQGTKLAQVCEGRRQTDCQGGWQVLASIGGITAGPADYGYEDRTVSGRQPYGWEVASLAADGDQARSHIVSVPCMRVKNEVLCR